MSLKDFEKLEIKIKQIVNEIKQLKADNTRLKTENMNMKEELSGSLEDRNEIRKKVTSLLKIIDDIEDNK